MPGERLGYSDTDHSMDYTLQSWIRSEQLHSGISRPRWTWKGRKGRTKQANLDHILSTHQQHDHLVVTAQTPATLLPPSLPRARWGQYCYKLDMDNWEHVLVRPDWYSHMVARAPEIIQAHATCTEATLGLWTE
eukprot:3495295-Rhodomonas_salina.3